MISLRAARHTGLGLLVLLVSLLGALAGQAPAGAASAAGSGRVYLVHGLVGETLDVVVDGTVVAPKLKPKSVVGPLRLAAGEHSAELRSGSTERARATLTIEPGSVSDVVAHRMGDAAGTPTLTVFSDDLSPVAPGKVRLAVAHTAAAPPADIRVDGKVLFSNVASGEALTLVVPAGSYSVDIVPTSAAGPVILGPLTLTPERGTLTRVFAVGDVKAGTMDAVVHQLPVRTEGAAVPGSVQTGDGGQLAERPRRAGLVAGALLLAALVVLVGSRVGEARAPVVGSSRVTTPSTAPSTAPATAGATSGRSVRAVTPVAPMAVPSGVGSRAPGAPTALLGDLPGRVPTFRPTGLVLPSGRTAPVLPAGVRADGTLAVPDDPARLGWWTGGAAAGEPYGGVVIAGHVDSRRFGPGVLGELLKPRVGATVSLLGSAGGGPRRLDYRIDSVLSVPKARLVDGTDAFRQDLPGRLVLITCGGRFDPQLHHYDDNVVVVATPLT